MLDFEPVDEHIYYLSLKGKFFNVTIIYVHVPTEDNNDIVKSYFCDRLDRVYHTIPKHDAVMVMGDMNAKVSKDPLTPCSSFDEKERDSNYFIVVQYPVEKMLFNFILFYIDYLHPLLLLSCRLE